MQTRSSSQAYLYVDAVKSTLCACNEFGAPDILKTIRQIFLLNVMKVQWVI